jgi:hypothetical protein
MCQQRRLAVPLLLDPSLRVAPPEEEDLATPPDSAATVAEGLKWFCWHGNLVRALATISDMEIDAEVAEPSPEQARFLKTLREFDTYLRANGGSIPTTACPTEPGEVVSSSLAESAVNQLISKRMVKKQQMRWSPRGARLLQVRTRALVNDDLAADFRRWYPGPHPHPRKQRGAISRWPRSSHNLSALPLRLRWPPTSRTSPRGRLGRGCRRIG